MYQVLQPLQKVELQANINKCNFYIQKTKFFSLIISIKDIWIDFQKVDTILKWACLISLRHVRSFLGFYCFYWHFIWDFPKRAKLFISLIKKHVSFDSSLIYKLIFKNLKKIVIKGLILAHYKQGLKIMMKTNLSNYVNSKVLFQLDENRLLYFIIFFPKNLNLVECNYKIYNKKLLAIIWCFE